MRTTRDIISDEDVLRVHGHANFGNMTPREVINEGVFKYMLGWESGWTQYNILREHKLITAMKANTTSYKSNLTLKGKKYARAMHHEGNIVFK